MKKILFFLPCVFLIANLSAQVGINTDNPQTDLDIKGSLLVTEEFQIGNLNTVNNEDENFKLVTRRLDSEPRGQLTVLDVDNIRVAPINIVEYEFINLNKDDIDVNLQYDANLYIVAISNFRHIGAPILKPSSNRDLGNFVTQTYIKDGMWHLEIGNAELSSTPLNGSIEYQVSLVIYDKAYFKQLKTIEINLGTSNTGSAPSPL